MEWTRVVHNVLLVQYIYTVTPGECTHELLVSTAGCSDAIFAISSFGLQGLQLQCWLLQVLFT